MTTPAGAGAHEAIRGYAPGDRGGVRAVCVLTGAAGADATGLYSTDDLLPDVFALPYVDYRPDLAFVVDHEEGVAGYVLAVDDTRAFVDWYRRVRVPEFAARYDPEAGPSGPEAGLRRRALEPERMLIPELDDHPAHLHIDLLPVLQGRGLGRALIERVCAELAATGVRGVHLDVAAGNAGALGFYPRVGFTELAREPGVVRFGRSLR